MSRMLTDTYGLGGRESISLNGSQNQWDDQLGSSHVSISVQKRGNYFPEKKKDNEKLSVMRSSLLSLSS